MNQTFSTQGEARRALGRIVRNASDLLEQCPLTGVWSFDVAAAEYLADMTPEDDMRLIQAELIERVAHFKSTPTTHEGDMNSDNTQYEVVEQTDVVEQGEDLTSVDATEGAEPTDEQGEGEGDKVSPLERARLRAQRAAELLARAEAAEAGRAEREAKAAERKAIREKRNAEREATKAERQAKLDAKAAAVEAKKKEREDAKAAKIATRERLAAERQAERDAARQAREATKVKGIAKPAAGTKLGNLWELIETLSEVNGAFPSFKEYSAANESMSYADAGGESTRTTAYYDYRMYHNITGRIGGNTEVSEGVDSEQEGQ